VSWIKPVCAPLALAAPGAAALLLTADLPRRGAIGVAVAVAALAFGGLYATRGLEAAMIADAASHVVFFGARLAGIGD
jgi:hypothetical protein